MSRNVFLNDQAYVDGEEDPRESLRTTLAFSVDDWAATRAMAWVWGIVDGWDDEAMAELAASFGWDETTTARLNRLHQRFDAARAGEGLDFIAQAQHLRTVHDETHGEAEQCGAECIVLGLTEFDDEYAALRAASPTSEEK